MKKSSESPQSSKTSDVDSSEKIPVEYRWREFIQKNDNLAYYEDTKGTAMLYHWGGKGQPCHWRMIDTEELRQMAERYFSATPGSYRKSAMWDCAAITSVALPNMRRPLKKLDDVISIAMNNAVLFIHEGGRIEARPITKHGQYILNYDDGANCRDILFDLYIPLELDISRVDSQGNYQPRKRDETESGLWGKLVNGMFYDDQDVNNFQEFFGDLMSKKQYKSFPVLTGDQDGGKSQLFIVARKLIVDNAMVDLTEMDGFNKETWIGQRLLIVDEGPAHLGTKAEAVIKRIIGGAGLSVQRKGQKSVHIDPEFKMCWAINNLMTFAEKTDAIRVRMRPFKTRTIPDSEQIPYLGKKICQKELSLVFDWALEGLARVERRGRTLKNSELSERSRAILETTREDTNPCLLWVREIELVPSTGKIFPTGEVYRMFLDWCESNGHRNISKVKREVFFRDFFYPAMQHLYPDTWNPKTVRKVNKQTANREVHLMVEIRNFRQADKYQNFHYDEVNEVAQMPHRVVAGPENPFN